MLVYRMCDPPPYIIGSIQGKHVSRGHEYTASNRKLSTSSEGQPCILGSNTLHIIIIIQVTKLQAAIQYAEEDLANCKVVLFPTYY